MRALRYFLCLALAMAMAACAARHAGSFCGSGIRPEQFSVIAEDATARLASVYPPGRTALHLEQAKRDGFGETLDGLLRERGFRLEPTAGAGVLDMAYTLDAINDEPGAWYLHVALSDGFAFSRAYTVGELTAPEAGVAQTAPERPDRHEQPQ